MNCKRLPSQDPGIYAPENQAKVPDRSHKGISLGEAKPVHNSPPAMKSAWNVTTEHMQLYCSMHKGLVLACGLCLQKGKCLQYKVINLSSSYKGSLESIPCLPAGAAAEGCLHLQGDRCLQE